MRIVVDAMLLGGRHSGVEVAIEGLCMGLQECAAGHDVLVLHRPLYDPRALGEGPLQFRAAPAWTNRRAGRILWERAFLPALARSWAADVLHAPGYVLPGGWNGPAVLTVYDVLAVTHPQWCKRLNAWHYGHALPASVRRADLVITPSETVRAEVIGLGGAADKVRAIALGVGAQMHPAGPEAVAAMRERHGLDRPYILWVGNLEPKKNLPGIVRGFELAAGRIEHDLVVAGKVGWRAAEAEAALATSPQRARIRRLGYVAPGELAALYSGADVTVQWSLYEGAGLPAVESMACGTPAVVSDGGALREWAGQVAPVVPLGDPTDLAECLVALLTDAGRREDLAMRGLEWARQFTWQRYATKVMETYNEACAARR
jgi:glycosyltransferase involved in cell wall biosynthesis